MELCCGAAKHRFEGAHASWIGRRKFTRISATLAIFTSGICYFCLIFPNGSSYSQIIIGLQKFDLKPHALAANSALELNMSNVILFIDNFSDNIVVLIANIDCTRTINCNSIRIVECSKYSCAV